MPLHNCNHGSGYDLRDTNVRVLFGEVAPDDVTETWSENAQPFIWVGVSILSGVAHRNNQRIFIWSVLMDAEIGNTQNKRMAHHGDVDLIWNPYFDYDFDPIADVESVCEAERKISDATTEDEMEDKFVHMAGTT